MGELASMPWLGGKSGAAPHGTGRWVASLLPAPLARTCYIEPFAGMLGVLLPRKAARVEIVNDADRQVVNWWMVMRDQPGELARRLAWTPTGRATYDQAGEALSATPVPEAPDVEAAWAFSVRVLQSFLADPTKDSWALSYQPAGGRPPIRVFESRLRAVADRISDVYLECGDAVRLLDRTADREDVVIYADPPYRSADSGYAVGVDHADLTGVLLRQRGLVAVSGYPGEHDALEGAGWTVHRRDTFTSADATGKSSRRTECLWCNYGGDLAGRLF